MSNAFDESAIGTQLFSKINDSAQIRVCDDGHFEMVFLLRDDLPFRHKEQTQVIYVVDEQCTREIYEKLSIIYQADD